MDKAASIKRNVFVCGMHSLSKVSLYGPAPITKRLCNNTKATYSVRYSAAKQWKDLSKICWCNLDFCNLCGVC